MVGAAVILQVGKVELRNMWEPGSSGYPPRRLRVMKPARPILAQIDEAVTYPYLLDINTIDLDVHRMFGLSVEFAYWHNSWQDAWAIEELLKFEGREDEIRRDKFYGEYFGRPSQGLVPQSERNSSNAGTPYEGRFPEIEPPRYNKYREADSQPVSSRESDVVFVTHESVRRRTVDAGPDVLQGRESTLQLEQLAGSNATDIS